MNTKLKQLKVTYEGHVYNYGKLATVIEDTVTIKAPTDSIFDIQAEIERIYGHDYGTFHVHKIEDLTNYSPVFIMNPRDVKTSLSDRAVIRRALIALINEQGRRINRVKVGSPQYEDAAYTIASARDLINRFDD